jgi:hypothetical protein
MLLCGHAGTSDGHVLTKISKNKAGVEVPQIMINAQDLDVSYFQGEAMSMLALLRFSADGRHMEIQYYSPYHDGTYHPSAPEMLSLTLDITGEMEKTPDKVDEEKTDDEKTDDEKTDDEKIDTPAEQPADKSFTLLIVCIVAAVLLVGGALAIAVVMRKKKK